LIEMVWDYLRRLFAGDASSRSSAGISAEMQFAALVRDQKVPAMAVRIQRGDEIILREAYGMADLASGIKARPDTQFRIASISKPITVSALARLVARGIIELDEPVTRYVPEFPEYGIRIRHLASHTAGIRGYRGKESALNRPLTIARGIDLFKEDPLIFPPGNGYLYNSFDFVLLSLAMERAAGCPFEELVHTEVLRPLSMDRTVPERPQASGRGKAMAYSRTRGGFRPAPAVDNRYKLAGGGYLSTVDDICRLGQAWLNEVIAPTAVCQPFIKALEVNGKSTWYGLGWEASVDPGGWDYYGHTGNSIGAYSIFRVYPQAEMVAVLLMNTSDPRVQPELEAALEAVKRIGIKS
jgi:CubicO group peptidase (beta-lactamase class C family)